MKLYKLTDKDGCTRNGTQWGPGVRHEAPGEGWLCTESWIHAYEHPLLAVLHDSIHGEFGAAACLWECETDDQEPLRDGQMKIGVRSLTTLREIPLPMITTEQRMRYAILCARQVCNDPEWVAWADAWLDGSDRTEQAAAEVARMVEGGTAMRAARATRVMEEGPAVRVAKAARVAARKAAWIAEEAARVAQAAAWVANRKAADVIETLDLVAIAKEATGYVREGEELNCSDGSDMIG